MRKVLFISLGCDKNLADSEEMLGMLVENGYTLTNDETEAEIIVVNTCAFIHDAKEESINSILEMARYKTEGVLKVLLVTGCLAQRYKEEIIKEIPEVDAVLGTTSFGDIIKALDIVFEGERYLEFKDINALTEISKKRVLTTGGYYGYLKIAEGCDKRCTYCIIPKLRGNYRSIPMEQLISQAEYLAGQGVRELILVAQETTVYGKDIYGKKCLHKLLKELCKIPGIQWIRILYCYPEEIYPELIQTMKEEKKICHYLDLPIQHCSDKILKKMGRRTTKQELIDIVTLLRKEIPDIILRTTLITGFPGETEEDHEELMEFIDTMEFDRLGVFTYSAEEDTPAANMPNQIAEEVKQDRQAELMELQQEISIDKGNDKIGTCVEVMIEGKVADENAYVGRTYGDAPNVDGYIFINTDTELMSGDFARVHVTGALEYDLIGELENEYTE
ncbi:30S ribosomal protein S12 methylthiotransferase RimO [Blautia hansenii]|uniref:Ribosomal protein uS12 methylthiotransferase RimO n=1 Tax=Blautia hansenii DSM 20583 TaxID=537007 RepID=C9L6A7_BLAHA|nr:30S ribosomal protein S12 methylthiotransferase RimO [Blautia hansenii]ASM69190.1 30S ribosomal protein S12 methylthiotransferase RimO [Blautia hansenii DSM 20583]EEX22689.1 ribosomal protein S12 methylthiotransferase RimO [Blautia hansenii DSM 20583]UWO11773.1 30S ribosomal protein S12 methylthiotransferase RimO [Blautia hansenii DSM 20583]